MPNKRPIPSVDTKNYAERGALYFKPFPPNVIIEMHHCSSFLSEAEALESIISFLKASEQVWGDQIVHDVAGYIEMSRES